MTADYILRRVEHIRKLSDGNWDFNNPTVLTKAYSCSIQKGINNVKDTLSFTLPNTFNTWFDSTNNILEDDLIRVYQWKNGTSYTDDDLLIEGTIKTINESITEQGRVLSIQGFDFIEDYFDNQLATYGDGFLQKNVVEMFKTILDQTRRFTPNRKVYWASSVNSWTGTPNPTVKSDGVTSFPIKDFVNNFRKVSDLFEELSSDKYTEDGQYIYYIQQQVVSTSIDPTGRRLFFVFKSKNDTLETTQITEGDGTLSVNVNRGKDEIVNFVIFNSGVDLYGQPVEYFNYDAISIGKYGRKTKYMVDETADIFNNLIQTEIEFDKTKTLFDYDADGNCVSRFPNSYPYTFQFETRDAVGNPSGTKATATSNNDYNKKLRIEAEAIGYLKAGNVIDNSAKPKYQVVVVYPFTTEYVLGGNYQVVVPSRNINKSLRIIDIKYDEFTTTLTLEEDSKNASY